MTSITQRAREAAQTTGNVGFADVQRQLVRGGYLRANLSGALTEFDIVAGGLAWGIRNSRYTIDVEFVENASIRDKLRVSENICHSLKEDMKSPHQLLPHQIQGLDYPCLAIVLKWLLQRVAMAREDHALSAARFTSWDFARRFHVALPGPHGAAHFAQTHQYWRNSLGAGAAANSDAVAEWRRPQRKLIAHDTTAVSASPLEHANAILLEYGDQPSTVLPSSPQQQQQQQTAQQSGASGGGGGEAIELDAAERRDLAQQREEEERERAMLERLLGAMAQHTEHAKVSSNELGALLAAVNTKRLAKVQRQYHERMAALQAQLDAEASERARVETKREELETCSQDLVAVEAKAARAEERLVRARDMVSTAEGAREDKAAELRRAQAACDKAEARLRDRGPDLAALLERAFAARDRIAAAEASLRDTTDASAERLAAAKAAVAQLTAELEAASAADAPGADGDDDTRGDDGRGATARALARAEQKLAGLEAELVRLDIDMLQKQRDIDSILSRAEYVQYEQRLEELDEECACKYDETQLLVREQNLQDEICRAIANEDAVLTNIFDSVKPHLDSGAPGVKPSLSSSAAAAKRASLAAVIALVQDFLKDIGALREAQDQRLQQEQAVLAERRAAYDSALSKQRAFRATVDEVARETRRLTALKRKVRELSDAV
jgi:hypothetical protein